MADIQGADEAFRIETPEPVPHKVRFAQIDPQSVKGRLIRNSNYNTSTVSIYGWCWLPEISKARKPLFMAALRESLRKEGVRNPIIVYALKEGNFLSFGGSRLLAAQELGLETIPAIVNDYCGRYKSCPLVTKKNYATFFTDVPAFVEFTPYGFDSHYSLERNRRADYDKNGIAWTENIEDASFLDKEFSWIKR